MSQFGASEKTFRAYTQDQGKAYAQGRRDFHPNFYRAVIDHHTSTGGQLDTLLDVGCGPGMVAHQLAPHFAHAIGIDPSEGMIATARSFNSITSTSEPVRFEISTAEDLSGIEDASIDLITAARAAHWFSMERFWSSAARVLRPGGSVALWGGGHTTTHPSMPNAKALQAAVDQWMEKIMPYFEPGNLLVQNRYVDLPLPWTLPHPVSAFDQNSFFRRDFGLDEDFFLGSPEVDMDTFEKMLATASPVTRWRQEHPDDVGTERDVVRMHRRVIERLLHEAGVERGKEKVKGAVNGFLLIVKKKA